MKFSNELIFVFILIIYMILNNLIHFLPIKYHNISGWMLFFSFFVVAACVQIFIPNFQSDVSGFFRAVLDRVLARRPKD